MNLECYEVTLQTVTNQDGAVIKHVEQYGLHITQRRPHTTHALCRDTTVPRVVVDNLVFRSHKRLINCLQIGVDYCHPRQLRTRCCVHLTHTHTHTHNIYTTLHTIAQTTYTIVHT